MDKINDCVVITLICFKTIGKQTTEAAATPTQKLASDSKNEPSESGFGGTITKGMTTNKNGINNVIGQAEAVPRAQARTRKNNPSEMPTPAITNLRVVLRAIFIMVGKKGGGRGRGGD
jgi:Neuraminidase (sialidase)